MIWWLLCVCVVGKVTASLLLQNIATHTYLHYAHPISPALPIFHSCHISYLASNTEKVMKNEGSRVRKNRAWPLLSCVLWNSPRHRTYLRCKWPVVMRGVRPQLWFVSGLSLLFYSLYYGGEPIRWVRTSAKGRSTCFTWTPSPSPAYIHICWVCGWVIGPWFLSHSSSLLFSQ